MCDDEDSANDSDVEVLNPRLLRATYFQKQITIIQAIKDCEKKVPRNWPLFKQFVESIMPFKPSTSVIRSVWKKMCLAEEKVSGNKLPVVTVELSDDEKSEGNKSDDDCVIISESPPPQKVIEDFIARNKKRVKQEDVPDNVSVASSSGSSSASIKSNKRKRPSGGKTSGLYKVPAVITNGDTSVATPSTKQKKILKKKSLTEEEAAALRERLLIDKLIELELPKVIKSYQETMMKYMPSIGPPALIPIPSLIPPPKKRPRRKKEPPTIVIP